MRRTVAIVKTRSEQLLEMLALTATKQESGWGSFSGVSCRCVGWSKESPRELGGHHEIRLEVLTIDEVSRLLVAITGQDNGARIEIVSAAGHTVAAGARDHE